MDTNVSKKDKVLTSFENTPTHKLPEIPRVAERFKALFSVVHKGGKHAEVFYEAEKFHFTKLIQESKSLQECTKMSLYGCFMDVAVNGLSFDPTFRHLYMVAYSHNIGTKDNKVWEKRAQLQIGGQGELLLRQRQRQIKYADNPVLVYESDIFKYGTKNNQVYVDHESILPRKSNVIVACYMRIVRIDGSVDYKVITQEDMDRFKSFSKDPNSKAWVSGLGGMWQSKCIKHAFKNYPKVRTGKFSALETEMDEVGETKELENFDEMHVPAEIEYGIDVHEDVTDVAESQEDHQHTEAKVEDDSEFAKPETAKRNNTVTRDDDDF